MKRANIKINPNYSLRLFKMKPLTPCKPQIGSRSLQQMSFRETTGLDKNAKIEYIKANRNQLIKIVTARAGKEENVLEVTENAEKNYQLFQLLKEGDFTGAWDFAKENHELELEPFIRKMVVFFAARQWGKTSLKSGKILKKYSKPVWEEVLGVFLESPQAVMSLPDNVLRNICKGSVLSIQTAVEMSELRRSKPELYGFSDGQITQIVGSPQRKELIIQKVREYSLFPKKLRPPISRIVKIGLSSFPEERFNFLDGEIAKKPKSISPIAVLATFGDFQNKVNEYRKLLKDGENIGLNPSLIIIVLQMKIKLEDISRAVEEGKDVGLTASSAVTILQAGITVEAVRMLVKEGEDIGLTTSSVVRIFQAGATVKAVRRTVKEGEDIGLTTSSAVIMLRAGITVKDVKVLVKEGKDIGLTAYSAVAMLQAGITVEAVRSAVKEGEDVGFTASSAVRMLQAGITVEAVRSAVKEGKDIGLSSYGATFMLQRGIQLEDLKAFLRKITFKVYVWKAILFLSNPKWKILIAKTYDFAERIEVLRSKHEELILAERIPKYLIELALVISSSSRGNTDFIRLHNEMEYLILFENKNPKKIFEEIYFPSYLKRAQIYFKELPLIVGRHYFSFKTEAFAAVRLSDFIYEDLTLQELIEDISVPSPLDLVMGKEIAEKAQKVLSPDEYQELIKYFDEYETGRIDPTIQGYIIKLRESIGIEDEFEEEEV